LFVDVSTELIKVTISANESLSAEDAERIASILVFSVLMAVVKVVSAAL